MNHNEKQKVPLQVGWLSEEGLLHDAAHILGYRLDLIDGSLKGATPEGVTALVEAGPVKTTSGTRQRLEEVPLRWEDHLLFSLDQLARLGFDQGEAL